MWILILCILTNRGAATIESLEFETRSGCLSAATFWLNEVSPKAWEISAVCVPKGV